MRSETDLDAKDEQYSSLASQATIYKELAPDVGFPWNSCLEMTYDGNTRSLIMAMDAIHQQLQVNASLLRTIVVELRESGSTGSFGLVRTDRNEGTQDEGHRRSPGVLGSDLVSGTEETSG
jgi:hypothetical protein